MRFEAKRFRRGSVRGVIGGFAVLVAAATALAVIPLSSTSAQSGTLMDLLVYPSGSTSGNALRQQFDTGTTDYTVWVHNSVSEVTVEPEGATPTYLDSTDNDLTDADANDAGHQVTLNAGHRTNRTTTTFKVKDSSNTYTVVVTRMPTPSLTQSGEIPDIDVPVGGHTLPYELCLNPNYDPDDPDSYKNTAGDSGATNPGQTPVECILSLDGINQVNYTIPENMFTAASATKITYEATMTGGGEMPGWLAEYPGSTGSVISRRFLGATPNSPTSVDITLTASNQFDGSATDEFTISVTNSNPDLNLPFRFSVPVGEYFERVISASELSDPDNHRVDLELDENHNSYGDFFWWVNIVERGRNDFMITGTPTRAGTTAVGFVASDGFGGSTTDTVRIEATNAAPTVANTISDQAKPTGRYFGITLAGDDGVETVNTFTDADGHFLDYSVSGHPHWLRVRGTPIFARIWAPPHVQEGGTFDITVTADDGYGGTATDTFRLRMDNNRPRITDAIPDLNICARHFVRIEHTERFTDDDGDSLTYTMTSPNWVSAEVNTTSGALIIKVSDTSQSLGTFGNVTVTASDPYGGSVTDTFKVTLVANDNADCRAGGI